MDKVKSYIEANKERFISELFDLLRIPSISAQSEHKPDMTRCAEWLAAALAKAGADRTEVLPDGGQPGRLRREDCRSQGQDRIGLRPLRRDARRPARGVAHGAFRAGHQGRPYLGARCRRRQGAAVDARQGIRGDVRHGEPALQREIHARRRGGDRLAEPLQVLRTEQKNAQGGYNIGVGHLDDLDADPVDHLRPARAGLYGGRGDGPRQRPPLGAVRRRRGQSRPTY